MRAYPVANTTHLTGQSEAITFAFCSECGTIVFGGDAIHCYRCGSSALERLGLGEIAARLRTGFAAGRTRSAASKVMPR